MKFILRHILTIIKKMSKNMTCIKVHTIGTSQTETTRDWCVSFHHKKRYKGCKVRTEYRVQGQGQIQTIQKINYTKSAIKKQ